MTYLILPGRQSGSNVRRFSRANNEYMRSIGSMARVRTGAPITLAVWANFTEQPAAYTNALLAVADPATFDLVRLDYHYANALYGYVSIVTNYDGTNNRESFIPHGAGGLLLDTWHHICGTYSTVTDPAVYADGSSVGNITGGTGTPVITVTEAQVGANYVNSTLYFPMEGFLAHAAIWDVVLTQAEITALAGGVVPLHVRRQNLVAYWPLGQGSYEKSEVGPDVLRPVNNPKIWSHIRNPIAQTRYPLRRFILLDGAAAAGVSKAVYARQVGRVIGGGF